MPPELKGKLQDFSKALIDKTESYRCNYDLIMSLTISNQNSLDVSDSVKKLNQSVKDREAVLQTLVEEINKFDEQEALVHRFIVLLPYC